MYIIVYIYTCNYICVVLWNRCESRCCQASTGFVDRWSYGGTPSSLDGLWWKIQNIQWMRTGDTPMDWKHPHWHIVVQCCADLYVTLHIAMTFLLIQRGEPDDWGSPSRKLHHLQKQKKLISLWHTMALWVKIWQRYRKSPTLESYNSTSRIFFNVSRWRLDRPMAGPCRKAPWKRHGTKKGVKKTCISRFHVRKLRQIGNKHDPRIHCESKSIFPTIYALL